jgi:hypothetical protein
VPVPNTARDRIISWGVIVLVPGFIVTVLLLSAHLPDARDGLSARQRASVGPVLDGAPACGNPFGRVTDVAFDDPGRPTSMRYRCAWTVLGIGARTSTAGCAEGQWQYAGWREMSSAGEC